LDVMKLINSDMLRILFQPIHDYKQDTVIGYEALARGPQGGPLEGAGNLFKAAARESHGREMMEMACFKKALSEYRLKLLASGGLFFVNFHADILASHCEEILSELDGSCENTVIEIAESYSKIRHISGYLKRLKDNGVRFALDDIGAGDRSLTNLCEIRADYFKIDRSIIQGLTKVKSGDAAYYRPLLRFLSDLAYRFGARVIAEGVETRNQLLETLTNGIFLMQGFYFSRPRPADFWVAYGQQVEERKA